MKQRINIIYIKAILCSVMLIALVCSDSKRSVKTNNDKNVITIGYQTPTSVTWGASVMKSNHLVEKELKKEGIKNYSVKWKNAQSGAPLVNLMKSEKMDVAFLGDMPAIITLTDIENKKYKPFLIGIDGVGKNGNGQCIVTKRDTNIKSVKSIATARGSSAERLVREAMSNTKRKYTIEYMDLNVAKMNLDKGNVDAISIWAPYTVLTSSKKYRIIFDGKKIKRDYLGLVVGNSVTLRKKIKIAIERALIKAHKIISQKSSDAIKSISNDTGFSYCISKNALLSLKFESINQSCYLTAIKSDYLFLKKEHLLKNSMSWKEFKNGKRITSQYK